MAKFLDLDGLAYFWGKIKAYVNGVLPKRVSELSNDTGYVTSDDVPSSSDTIPNMDGVASAGIETTWAKGDHVHPSDTSKQDVIDSTHKLSYNFLKDTPTIPSEVTESTVSGWGFTKNTGTYSKPSGGIPSTDMTSAVQTSLGKADSAYQKPSGGIPSTDIASGVIPTVPTALSSFTDDLGTSPTHSHSQYITSHQDISGKADKVTSATNGNFAALDGNGNLTDSGHKHSDYLTSHQSLVGYAKYYLCADEAEYEAIQDKQSDTLYLIPES